MCQPSLPCFCVNQESLQKGGRGELTSGLINDEEGLELPRPFQKGWGNRGSKTSQSSTRPRIGAFRAQTFLFSVILFSEMKQAVADCNMISEMHSGHWWWGTVQTGWISGKLHQEDFALRPCSNNMESSLFTFKLNVFYSLANFLL